MTKSEMLRPAAMEARVRMCRLVRGDAEALRVMLENAIHLELLGHYLYLHAMAIYRLSNSERCK